MLSIVIPASAKTPQQIFEAAAPSIVVVEVSDLSGKLVATGSGVVISRGEIITNCHVAVVGMALQIKRDGLRYPATIRYADRDRDVCQLSAPDLSAPSAVLGYVESLTPGARVIAIGAPEGLELSISEGLVSALRSHGSGSKLIQTTTPISPGSSGGGLFDDSGRLVGITTFFLKEGQNLNFAIPVDWLRDLPRRHAENRNSETTPAPNFDIAATNSLESATGSTEAARDAAYASGIARLAALGAEFKRRDKDFPGRLAIVTPYIDLVSKSEPPQAWEKLVEAAYWALSDDEIDAGWLATASSLRQQQDWLELNNHALLWTVSRPSKAAGWLFLGIAQVGLGDRLDADATVFYQQAKERYPSGFPRSAQEEADKERLYQQGSALVAEAKDWWSSATRSFKRGVAIDSTNSDGWLSLGWVSLKLEDRADAVKAYRALKNLDAARAEKLLTAIGMP